MSREHDEARRRAEEEEVEARMAAEHGEVGAQENDSREQTFPAVDMLFSTAPLMEAPDGFTERVLAAIKGKLPGRRWPRFKLPWMPMVISLMAATGVAASWLTRLG